MKGEMPAIWCDAEDGLCTEWQVDYYEMTASNWRELMDGWTYDPYKPEVDIFCPNHKPLGQVSTEGEER